MLNGYQSNRFKIQLKKTKVPIPVIPLSFYYVIMLNDLYAIICLCNYLIVYITVDFHKLNATVKKAFWFPQNGWLQK